MRQAAPDKSITYALVVAIAMSFLFQEVAFIARLALSAGPGNLERRRCTAGIVSSGRPAQILALCLGGGMGRTV
jgi:hypothetical protein